MSSKEKTLNPKFKEYYKADISFFKGNPIHRYIVQCVNADIPMFEVGFTEDYTRISERDVQSLTLIEKIDMS